MSLPLLYPLNVICGGTTPKIILLASLAVIVPYLGVTTLPQTP